MNRILAPVCLFTYKRLDTLISTVDALKDNYLAPQSELFIFSDGPKKEIDKERIEDVRAFLNTIDGFKSVTIKKNVSNKGLAQSIIDGVSETLNLYGKVIVLEDDLITTPNFLNFMNDTLVQYENVPKVFSISGYSFNLGIQPNELYDNYFLNRGWSWGWSTWRDRWNNIDWEVKDYNVFKNDKKARREFSLGGSDLNGMLDKQMSGNLDSWAIRWFYHQFRIKGLTAYPVFSKVYNNGFDNNATHTTGSAKRYLPILDNENKIKFSFLPIIKISTLYQKRFSRKMSIISRILSKIQTIFKDIFAL